MKRNIQTYRHLCSLLLLLLMMTVGATGTLGQIFR